MAYDDKKCMAVFSDKILAAWLFLVLNFSVTFQFRLGLMFLS